MNELRATDEFNAWLEALDNKAKNVGYWQDCAWPPVGILEIASPLAMELQKCVSIMGQVTGFIFSEMAPRFIFCLAGARNANNKKI